MDNFKLLICGIYTGYPCNIIENKFKTYYKCTIYENTFNKYITYNFFDNDTNGCVCNLLDNIPIINFNDMTLVKINDINYDNFIEIYKKAIKIDSIYKDKIKNIMIKDFYKFINFNHYIYRNLKKNNQNNNFKIDVEKSIFKNEENIELCTEKFKLKLLEYYEIIEFLFEDKYKKIIEYIYNMEKYDDYEWHNIVIKIINDNILLGDVKMTVVIN
jgi:hypothetical protein